MQGKQQKPTECSRGYGYFRLLEGYIKAIAFLLYFELFELASLSNMKARLFYTKSSRPITCTLIVMTSQKIFMATSIPVVVLSKDIYERRDKPSSEVRPSAVCQGYQRQAPRGDTRAPG
jgi:hypothetical protein